MPGNILRKISILILVTILVTASFSGSCSANVRNKTVKTVKSVSMTPSKVNKKAAKVKTGTTNLKFQKGYIKFTAPKKGTYTFSFSDLTGENASAGFFFYRVKTKGSLQMLKQKKVKTEGGKSYIIRICQKDSVKNYSNEKKKTTSSKVTVLSYLPSRTAKITLAKKQTIYIYLEYFVDSDDSWGNVTLNIKREKL